MMELLGPYVDIYLGETLSTSFEARAFLAGGGIAREDGVAIADA